ncbi:MAG TPA: hypothetical protein VLF88_03095 [Candidatus Babeliales bacterium]|nr:hypothetical protein [Candidatus Babeliales bacterium]
MAVLSALLIFTITPFALAQQSPSGSGLSISPTISELTINPGGTNHVTITLKNITVDDVVAKGAVNDFTSDNITGNPQIITNPNIQSPNSIKKFVTNIDDVALAKGEQKTVVLGLEVPKNTTPGAYYGIVRYRAIPKALNTPGPGQVALTASVGTIVLITVPGNVREQVQVKGIHIFRGSREGSFFIKPPTSIGITITNFGNGFVKPFGTVEVNNTFKKAVTSFQLNNPKQLGNILPNSTRTFTNNIKGVNRIGRYTVLASVSYGSGSQVLTLKKDFWYIPLWLVVIILVVLGGLIFLAVRAYRNYRRGRRHSSKH